MGRKVDDLFTKRMGWFGMSNKVLFKWELPKEAQIKASKDLLSFGLEAMPRVLTIIGIILLLFYLFAAYYLDRFIPGFSRNAIKAMAGLGLFGLFLTAWVLFGPVLTVRLKCTYAITEKGISKKSVMDSWFVPWKIIKGYAIIKDEEGSLIALESGRKRFLSYSPELEGELDRLLGSKIIKLESEVFNRKVQGLNIEGWQWMFLLGVVIAWIVVVGYWVRPFMKWFHNCCPEWVLMILFICCLFVGPATVAFFLLFGWRTFKPKEGVLPLLPLLNMFSWMLTLFSGVIWEIERFFRGSGQ